MTSEEALSVSLEGGSVPGPIALVGSGEFLPQMVEIDRFLLSGRVARAAFLPTAAGEEGPLRFQHWLDLGRAHYEAMGVEAVPVPIVNAADANDPALVERLTDVGLIYLSGGNPGYLAATLRGSLAWDMIVTRWKAGVALAGCSAGAGALTAVAPDVRGRRFNEPGLGLIPNLAVIPHYDKMIGWDPGFATRMTAQLPAGVHMIGIDEDTALVGGPTQWTVMGRQSVHILLGTKSVFHSGEELTLA
jgi:cyanophycinase